MLIAPGAVTLQRVERPAPARGSLFAPLTEQIANVRRWNDERGWGFTSADLDAIDLRPADHREPLVVDVIAVYLPGHGDLDGIRRTCLELWTVATDEHPAGRSWEQRKAERMPVTLLDGIEHRPGIRRVTLDLGAHWRLGGTYRLIDVRGPDSAHAEILAAAAHFPYWVWAMDGTWVPYTWVPGY